MLPFQCQSHIDFLKPYSAAQSSHVPYRLHKETDFVSFYSNHTKKDSDDEKNMESLALCLAAASIVTTWGANDANTTAAQINGTWATPAGKYANVNGA
jgi:hypothetical protein